MKSSILVVLVCFAVGAVAKGQAVDIETAKQRLAERRAASTQPSAAEYAEARELIKKLRAENAQLRATVADLQSRLDEAERPAFQADEVYRADLVGITIDDAYRRACAIVPKDGHSAMPAMPVLQEKEFVNSPPTYKMQWKGHMSYLFTIENGKIASVALVPADVAKKP